MTWTAVIPSRIGGPRKTRLAGCLSAFERERLSEFLLENVSQTVRSHPAVEEAIVLSPLKPSNSRHRWWPDGGSGLNLELAKVLALLPKRNVLVVHADLPFLSGPDLTTLIAEAEFAGIAIAPDHTGEGTNAVAICAGQLFTFAFGPNSLAAHLASGGKRMRVVNTMGLAHDIDNQDDLGFALDRGLLFECRLRQASV